MNTIYEIIRVIRSHPIFLEEHLERLDKSLDLLVASRDVDRNLIKKAVYDLCSTDPRENFNIRLNYYHKLDEYTFEALKGHYPTPDMELEGVRVATYEYKRENPNIKVFDMDLRKSMQHKKDALDVFEVLYVDEDLIYEGSKSNVFFIEGDKVVTSEDSDVLQGITRLKVLEVCEALGYEVEKRSIHRDDLVIFRGAFLTGTSINVLPIRRIDDRRFDPDHPMIEAIRRAYKQEVIKELDKPMDVETEAEEV